MTARRNIIAVGFALAWLLILRAGADCPPPPGFVWLLPVLVGIAVLVHWRLPMYERMKCAATPWRLLRVAAEGAVTGLLLAIALHVTRTPDPIHSGPTGTDVAIWIAVLAAFGCANALLVYSVAPSKRPHAGQKSGV